MDVFDTVFPRFEQKLIYKAQYLARNWQLVILYQIAMLTMLIGVLYLNLQSKSTFGNLPNETLEPLAKRWGGYKTGPQSLQCYRKERTAIMLSVFLGAFGIDQFYAHHWVLAVFKLLTLGGMGLWAMIDTIMWIVGGIYGIPGCGGGYGG